VTNPVDPFRLLSAETVQAKPGEGFERSDWNCWTFEYILSGYGRFEIDGTSYALGPGDMYVLPKGMAHGYWGDSRDPWRKHFFVVDGPMVSQLLAAYHLETTYCFETCGALHWFSACHDLIRSGTSDMNDKATLLFHEFIIHLANLQKSGDPAYSGPVDKAISYLNANVENPISMDDVAQEAGRSKSHLSRVFSSEVGVTPYDYLIGLRIDLAKTLLSLTPFTIAEIANRLCYADAYYFSNAFKQRMGVSPKAFRLREAGG
jgi:AraC-like DNA-binding protein